jgi:hypothetical protein
MLKYKTLFLSSQSDRASLFTSQRKIKINQPKSLKLIGKRQNIESTNVRAEAHETTKNVTKRVGGGNYKTGKKMKETCHKSTVRHIYKFITNKLHNKYYLSTYTCTREYSNIF